MSTAVARRVSRPRRLPVETGRRKRVQPVGCVALLLLVLGCRISPDLLDMPRHIYDYWTNPDFVVNAPVLHELIGVSRGVPDEALRRTRFRLPPGFVMDVYAEDLPLARFMKVTPAGDVIVTQPRRSRVVLVERDRDGDGRTDATRVLLDGLHLPHGVELVADRLFIAGPGYLVGVGFDVDSGAVRGEPEPIAKLPDRMGHPNRPLRLGPDGWLYTAIGADCNVCEPTTARDQAILRLDPATGREEVVASGFRNVAHFDWQPGTNAMFATEVGADHFGDELPLEELNEIVPGGFYGFPFLHGPDLRDPTLAAGNEDRIAISLPSAHAFVAHSTPLGMTFLRGEQLPDDYRGAALVVLRGSWNRTRKSGYKVVSLHWREGPEGSPRIEEREFLVGFERDEVVIGRPVDIVEGPDGSLFLSDDMAGAIYRIRHEPVGGLRDRRADEHPLAPPVAGLPSARHPLSGLSLDDRRRLVEQGRRLFGRHGCPSCHAGSSGAVSLSGLASRRSFAEVLTILRTPPASMPRHLLTDEERIALAVYVLDAERSSEEKPSGS